MIMPALSAIDGTCVIEGGENGFKGAFSTKGDATAALSDLISEFTGATVNKDGKILRFQKGLVDGKIKNDEVADLFKGAMIAAVISDNMSRKNSFDTFPFKDMFMALIPAENSMQLEVTVNSGYPKENYLLTFIKAQ